MLKKTFEETRGKQRREWEVEAEQLMKKKELERLAQKKTIGEMTEKFNYLSEFKVSPCRVSSERENTNES